MSRIIIFQTVSYHLWNNASLQLDTLIPGISFYVTNYGLSVTIPSS